MHFDEAGSEEGMTTLDDPATNIGGRLWHSLTERP